jgi:hypothetical protein
VLSKEAPPVEGDESRVIRLDADSDSNLAGVVYRKHVLDVLSLESPDGGKKVPSIIRNVKSLEKEINIEAVLG